MDLVIEKHYLRRMARLGKIPRFVRRAWPSCLPALQGSWPLAVRALLFVLALSFSPQIIRGQQPPANLTERSLEELMNIEVTSVSKKEEKLFQTAAAIYVITQEDIRRSGLTSIPELLRLVPGLDVERIDGNKWAVTARGFNGQYANKLLVLIDSRSVYSPVFAGVYWDVQDLLLEDIERIEIIRGPGGTLWGANAVNGVINIITKKASETLGGLLTAGGGTEERGFGSFRYGGKIGEKADYRIYAKYFNRGSLLNALGRDANDGQQVIRGGGRVDWELSERNALTLQGDIYGGSLRETPDAISAATPFAPAVNTRATISGGNVLARWNHVFSPRSDMALQLYYDRTSRQAAALNQDVDAFDLDFQHRFTAGRRHDIVWGLGYRFMSDESNSNSVTPVQFIPKDSRYQLFSGFVQDEMTLIKDRLRLTLGSKLEHNDYSGFEAQPSLRLLWTPGAHQTFWGAISRAVRTPSRGVRDLRVNIAAFPGQGGLTNLLALFGDPNFKTEDVLAYEVGYRLQPSRKLSFDVATFYNLYHRLNTVVPDRPFFETDPQPSHLVIPLRFKNLMRGETYGLEAAANWDLTSNWRLQGSYSLLRVQLHRDDPNLDAAVERAEQSSPRHQFQLHSYFKLPRDLELDTALYHTPALVAQQLPSRTRLDARLGWRVRESIELSVGLQNLLGNRRQEFNGVDLGVLPSRVKRGIYGKVTWRF